MINVYFIFEMSILDNTFNELFLQKLFKSGKFKISGHLKSNFKLDERIDLIYIKFEKDEIFPEI